MCKNAVPPPSCWPTVTFFRLTVALLVVVLAYICFPCPPESRCRSSFKSGSPPPYSSAERGRSGLTPTRSTRSLSPTLAKTSGRWERVSRLYRTVPCRVVPRLQPMQNSRTATSTVCFTECACTTFIFEHVRVGCSCDNDSTAKVPTSLCWTVRHAQGRNYPGQSTIVSFFGGWVVKYI